MNTPSLTRTARLMVLGAGAATLVSVACGQTIAYEQFNGPLIAGTAVPAPTDTPLAGITASGMGFEDWVVTNKGGAGDSVYKDTGLSYPGNYDGSLTAAGGSALISNINSTTGNATHSLMFDATALATVSSSTSFYFSFLAERQGAVSDPDLAGLDPLLGPYGNYPRNFGIRLLNGAGNSNSNMGTFGQWSDWGNVNDEWRVDGAKDTHKLLTGENFADGTDLIVFGVRGATTAPVISIWINPDSTTTDPNAVYHFTDGGPVVFNLTGLGTEAGSASSGREASVWTLDEIVVGLTGLDGAGLANLVAVPEPSMVASLLGLFAIGAMLIRRRR